MTTGRETGRGAGPLPSPELAWERGHTPVSARFADVYTARDDGLAQSRHVFLAGNDLPQAWRNKELFCIVELGFGTGLNFLATWDLWRRTRTPGSRLHYIAVEGFPLKRDEVRACLAPWSELHDLARGLCAVYPEPQRGFHRVFPTTGDANDVSLTLLYGDAGEMLAQVEAEADAWFLDGFAPDKNPDMWSKAVFAEMARLSKQGTSAATFSAADSVRRGLDETGFDVSRAAGFSGKHEISRARFRAAAGRTVLQPWFARAPHHGARGHAAIIGAGLAGAHAAAALSRRGWTTTLIDRQERIAAEASATPRAIMTPRLTARDALDGRFYAAAWRYALAQLEAQRDAPYAHVGSLQLSLEREAARFSEIAAAGTLPASYLMHLNAQDASDVAGLKLPSGGLYFPQGGWQDPGGFCEALTADSTRRLGAAVAGLDHTGGQWNLRDADQHLIAQSDVVILGNGANAHQFHQAAYLPVEARRGQLTLAPTNAVAEQLRAVLLYGGFVTPAHHGVHVLGATFDMEAGTDVRTADHARNLESLAQVLPGLLGASDNLAGFAAVRCMSPDHLPMVGPLPERGAYMEDFAHLRHGHPWARYPNARYQPGLYVLTALGARGTVSAPLAAELLACHITGEPWPLERDLVTALHPARFLVRDLKRREI